MQFNKKQIFTIAFMLVTITCYTILFVSDANSGTLLFKKHTKSQKAQKAQINVEKPQQMENEDHLECNHDHRMEQDKKLWQKDQKVMDEVLKLPKVHQEEEEDWQPIRILFNYENLENMGDEFQEQIDFLKNEIMPATQAYFQTAYKVHRLTTPITPSIYYTEKGMLCCETTIPSSLKDGTDGVDIIFVVNAENVNDTQGHDRVHASKCHQGEQEIESGRPTLGRIIVNLQRLKTDSNTSRFFFWQQSIIHQINHALGFTTEQFPKFLNNQGLLNVNSQGQLFFKGEKTLAYGKEYFSCDTVEGLPLENDGGDRKVGSHWERTTFGNEGMTANLQWDMVFSKFTMNLFRDSGWYEFDEEYMPSLEWGKNQGCRLMAGICDKSSDVHDCKSGSVGCSFDYAWGGMCVTDPLTQECPYLQRMVGFSCIDPESRFVNYFEDMGGNIAADSRCLELTHEYKTDANFGCFRTYCGDDVLYVKIADQWFLCNEYDENWDTTQVISYKHTSIKCPPRDQFCNTMSTCEDDCTGQGVCENNECKCFEGYSGVNCQINDKGEESQATQNNKPGYVSEEDLNKQKYGSSHFCEVENGDFLIKREGKDEFECCNLTRTPGKFNYECCPLFQTSSNGYCSCKSGYYKNWYTSECETYW